MGAAAEFVENVAHALAFDLGGHGGFVAHRIHAADRTPERIVLLGRLGFLIRFAAFARVLVAAHLRA